MENGEEFGLITSFHRIIMPSVLRECRLVLPKKFVDEYGDHLSNTLKLYLPKSAVWYVGLKESDGLLYLCIGWENFMKRYSIRFGHLLVFIYKGNSDFDVHIFDPTATEIHYPVGCSGSDKHGFNGEGSCGDVMVEDDDGSRRKGKAILTDSLCKTSWVQAPVDKAAKCRNMRLSPDLVTAAEMYQTENPFFIVKLKDYSVNLNILYLPRPFTREHMSGCSEFIEILDSSNKKWPVRLYIYDHDNRMMLSTGWKQFVEAQGLETGDVCVFELVTAAVMKVSVFPAKKPCNHPALNGKGSCSDVKLEDDDDAQLVTASRRKRTTIPTDLTTVSDQALAAAELYETDNPFLIVKLKDYNMKNMVYLPRTFTREHMKGCSEFIEILDSDNMKWPVRFKRYDRDWTILSTGWTEFVQAQGIKTGDVCLFELIAASVMKVSVFYAIPRKLSKRPRVQAVLMDNAVKWRNVKLSPDLVAATEMYKSENPFFIVKLKDYNVNKNMLYLPRTFTTEHMSGCSEFIEILDSSNKKWPVRLYIHDHDDRMVLSTGWIQFVEAQGLNSSDVCVFELISAAVMKVSVFNAKPAVMKVSVFNAKP